MFDTLWKKGLVSRKEAYRLLAAELGIPEKEAHMSIMDSKTARRVPAAVARIRTRLMKDAWDLPRGLDPYDSKSDYPRW